MATLKGKVALVTGGSRSMGAAMAKRLAADGASVALTYSASPDKANEVVRGIEADGGKARAIQADAADVVAVRTAVAETVKAFGRLDILVNNAGMAILKPIDNFSLEDFDRIVAVNVKVSSSPHKKPCATWAKVAASSISAASTATMYLTALVRSMC